MSVELTATSGAAVFGATSTTDDVLDGVDLRGMRVLVTGVSAGLGIETARVLAARGAQVVGAARDLQKARAATDALHARGDRFDVVIANAGVMASPFGHTADGFETQFGTNHLGHFLFVNRIASLIKDGGRFVSVASSGHRYANVDLDDPHFERTAYEPFVAYGRSKTANILFAVEFDRRHRARGVRAAALHPGGIKTELGRHVGQEALDGILTQINEELAGQGKPPFAWKTIPQGAATSVWAGFVANADEIGGRYLENCHVTTRITDGYISAISEGVRPYALDADNAKALWAKSEELVGETF